MTVNEDDILEIDLTNEDDSEEEVVVYNHSAPQQEFLAETRKNSEELQELKAKQAKLDLERQEQENARLLYAFEQRFPNMGEEEKAFVKGLLQINNQIIEKQLAERDAKLEALSRRLYNNELASDNLKSFINNVDYRTTMQEICDIALREKFEGKLAGGVKQAYKDFALAEYELRIQNDENFALKVKSITSDPKLKPAKIKSKLAEMVKDNFIKSYIEKYKKTGKRNVDIELPEDKKSKKKEDTNPATEAKAEEKAFAEIDYKKSFDKLLRSI